MNRQMATPVSAPPVRSAGMELAADFPALQLARTGRVIRLLGRITFGFLIISLAALFFVPWRQTARGTGIVTALDPQQRPQPVRSPAKGVIDYVRPGLMEGIYVEEGELLLKLAPFASEGVRLVETQIAALEAKRAAEQSGVAVATQAVTSQKQSGEAQTRSLRQDLQAANEKYEQAKNEVQQLQAELEDKKNQLRISEQVLQQGIVSREEVFSQRQAVEAYTQKVLKAGNFVDETQAIVRSKTEELEAKTQELAVKNRTAEQKLLEAQVKVETVKKELIDLQKTRDEMQRMTIKAPRSGIIQEWFGVSGSDTVKEGDQLCVIVPQAKELAVEMKVSGNDMPLIKEGDTVRLQFEGWPAVQFVGWPSVAVGTFGGKVNRTFPTDDGKGNFRVLVTPQKTTSSDLDWPDDRYLRQGVRANGWVLLKQVPLGYEIWRQLNGFPPTVADEAPGQGKSGGKVMLPKT